MSDRRRAALTAAVVLLLPVLLTWPLALHLDAGLPAAVDQEAATHLWGLWAALETGHPLVVDTDLIVFPDGARVVLVDPGHLPAFALGSLVGPFAGYNLVVALGFVWMGLAGALLAREVGGHPAVGAAVAAACPTVLGHAAEGMTEGAGVGWVGIQLALLLRFVRGGPAWTGAAAAGALAMAAYCGPYNGVWAGLLDVALGVGLLVRARRQGAAPVGRAAGVAVGAAALLAPLAWAVLGARDGGLPGSAERAGLPRVHDWPDRFRGGLETGADLLDPLLPVALTGGEAPVSHTAYVGLVLFAVACAAVWRDRRRWPWLAGAAAFMVLSLGPWLYVGGRALRVGGGVVPGPAAALMLAVPGLARVTRWYRAGAVATLLLAPLASTVGRHPFGRGAVVLVVLLDALLLAPVAWPLRATPAPDITPYTALDGDGALVELPPATTGEPPPGRWRDRTVLAQVFHGRPVGGGAMGRGPSDAARGAQARLETVMRGGALPPRSLAKVRQHGFRWLAVYPEYRSMPADAQGRIEACFGPPVAASDEVWLYDLSTADGRGCPASGREPKPPRN